MYPSSSSLASSLDEWPARRAAAAAARSLFIPKVPLGLPLPRFMPPALSRDESAGVLAEPEVDPVSGVRAEDALPPAPSCLPSCALKLAGRIARRCGLGAALLKSLGVSTSDKEEEAGAKRGIGAFRAGTFIRRSSGIAGG